MSAHGQTRSVRRKNRLDNPFQSPQLPGMESRPPQNGGLMPIRRMRARFLKFVKWLLLIWGCLSLAAIIVVGAFAAYEFASASLGKDDSASPHDVRFVLNWCRLGDSRIVRVVHSHVSARALTGDHLDAYAIKISHVDDADLAPKSDDSTSRWYRGDQLPQVLDKAVRFVGEWHHEIPWFPTDDELRSAKVYVYSWSIEYHGIEPSAAEIIFVRPSDQMVFYFGGST